MPSREPVLPVSTLREAARQHAKAVGMRKAARHIGMSTMGLVAFLGGTTPQERTVRRLMAWYVADRSRQPDVVDIQDAEAALTLLFAHLPEDRQAAAVVAGLDFVEQHSRATGVEPPKWVERLREWIQRPRKG